MSSAAPWMKFYPTDWRADPRLRMCSLTARGLWIEMLTVMHEAVPYGHLLVSGRPLTDAQLAALAGAPTDQVSDAVGELEAAGVFSRTREGVIYSRRMTRDAKKSAIARKNGKNGGNPSLSKTKENAASDNQNPTERDKPQRPEARGQNTPKAPDGGEPDSFAEFWGAYPKRMGGNSRKNAAKRYAAALRAGAKPEEIMRGLSGYAAEQRRMGKIGTPFIKAAEAWLNAEMWREYAAPPPSSALPASDLLTDTQWRQQVQSWLDRGRVGWRLDRITPSPAEPDCRIPAHILAEFGLQRRAA